MNYVLIGLAVSIGWHVGKLVYGVIEEVVMTNLHAADWYAVLCKKMPKPEKIPAGLNSHMKELKKAKEQEPYKGTSFGFRAQ